MSASVLWLITAGVFLVVEFATVSMCSVWFAVGALVSAGAAALGASVTHQFILFILVSAICFAVLYPKLKHLIDRGRKPTNADMVIGQTCIVTQRIDNLAETGTVSVGGKTWTARTESPQMVEEGCTVRVERIEGVKLIVTPVNE